MPPSIATIRDAFAALRRGAKARHRDIAEQLGLSEGELIAAHAEPAWQTDPPWLGATRLRPDWPALIAALEPLGELMALTRNSACVHEKTGVYRGVSQHGGVGLVLGEAIDLRLFYVHGRTALRCRNAPSPAGSAACSSLTPQARCTRSSAPGQ
jgi:putative hemin transport protein